MNEILIIVSLGQSIMILVAAYYLSKQSKRYDLMQKDIDLMYAVIERLDK